MRNGENKKSPKRMIVYLLLLAAVAALGYFSGLVDFSEYKDVMSMNLNALLRLWSWCWWCCWRPASSPSSWG